MSTPAAEDVVAAELVAARRERRSLIRFPGGVPASVAEAYQIQELAMSRWQDSLVGWKIGYISADRRAPGLVLGSVLADWPGGAQVQFACYVDGQLMGEGSAENLPGGIHHGLATALNILASRGQPVRGGMVFATGAVTGIHPIGPGQHCRVEVRGGPSVELRTVDARTLMRS
jgi:2-keto-4-pentenoate hydratase